MALAKETANREISMRQDIESQVQQLTATLKGSHLSAPQIKVYKDSMSMIQYYDEVEKNSPC